MRRKAAEYDFYKQRDDNNKNNEDPSICIPPSTFTARIPQVGRDWLHKYGISDQEIQHYRIGWNTKTFSLVFPIFTPEGKLRYYQERYFGSEPNHPKYITFGDKSFYSGLIIQRRNPEQLVLVEDFVSAIKVARITSSCPLLGSKINASTLKSIQERFKQVRVWLDRDKAVEALQEASKLFGKVGKISTIITPLDPKEYSTPRIAEELAKAGLEIK